MATTMRSKVAVPIATPLTDPLTAINYSGEVAKIQSLVENTSRTNSGTVVWTSPTSGITYDTSEYSSNSNIDNKGETGLYNLLIYLYGKGGTPDLGFIFTADDYENMVIMPPRLEQAHPILLLGVQQTLSMWIALVRFNLQPRIPRPPLDMQIKWEIKQWVLPLSLFI